MVETRLAIDTPGVALKTHQYNKKPTLSKVFIYNDDYTPMEFVVDALESVFHISEEYATKVMMQAHYEGKALLGTYPTDIAETKVHHVVMEAHKYGHPLLCMVVRD